jgi:hypothetical protein
MRRMRTTIRLLLCLAALTLVGTAAAVTATGQFRASLTATTHSPTVNGRWTYYISARTLKGKRLHGSAHVQVFEHGKRVNIIGWHEFTGSYHQGYRWPVSTRGHKYVFQALIIATGANGKKSQLRLNYSVSPK